MIDTNQFKVAEIEKEFEMIENLLSAVEKYLMPIQTGVEKSSQGWGEYSQPVRFN